MTDALREALQELVDADDALAAHQARGYMVGDAWDFDDTQRRLSARRAEARTAARTALQEPAPVVQPERMNTEAIRLLRYVLDTNDDTEAREFLAYVDRSIAKGVES